MANVFISYRRDDSLAVTKRIAFHLQRLLGKRNVFIDFSSIAGGELFPQRLQVALQRADVVLVVIGPAWASAVDATGQRRLENPRDFVRFEVGSALASGKPVIPLFIDGVTLGAAELPADLAPLLKRSSLALSTHEANGPTTPLALRQLQGRAYRAELQRMPRIPYPLITLVSLLAAVGGLIIIGASTFPLFHLLAPNTGQWYFVSLVIGLLLAGVRMVQDRLWGWGIVFAVVLFGPLLVGEINPQLLDSTIYAVAVITALCGLSLSGKRIAHSITIWRIDTLHAEKAVIRAR